MFDNTTGVNIGEPAEPRGETADSQNIADPSDNGSTEANVSTAADGGTSAGADAGAGNSPGARPTAQSAEDNARFAAARREAEQKLARMTGLIKNYGRQYDCYSDEDVTEKYGGQGINTLEQLAASHDRQAEAQSNPEDRAAAESQAAQRLRVLFEQFKGSDPDYIALRKAHAEAKTQGWVSELRQDFPDVAVDMEKPDLGLRNADKIGAILRAAGGAVTLTDAYKLANFDSIRQSAAAAAEQQTIRKLLENGRGSPGSLSGGEPPAKGVWNMAKDDFSRMVDRAKKGELTKI